MTTIIETQASIISDPFFFEAAVWERKQLDGQIAYGAIPGTWFRPQDTVILATGILALVACPNCKGVSGLSRKIHRINSFGKLMPNFICPHSINKIRCSFNRDCYLDRWNKKPLYAIALEYPTISGGWRPVIEYCHATNEAEVRKHLGPGSYRIVAIGPVIGYNVEDKEGKKLSV
jgi:hypothetical protein